MNILALKNDLRRRRKYEKYVFATCGNAASMKNMFLRLAATPQV
jgi:hypothetical protein